MNIEVILDKIYKEVNVKIFSASYSKEVEIIKEAIENLQKNPSEKIVAFKKDEIKIIDYKEISRFYSENNKLYLDSKNSKYLTKLRIYELEERLPRNKFIKISRSEIVNLDYVEKLDLSFTGTIALKMKDGKITYVSRRNIKKFKEILGI